MIAGNPEQNPASSGFCISAIRDESAISIFAAQTPLASVNTSTASTVPCSSSLPPCNALRAPSSQQDSGQFLLASLASRAAATAKSARPAGFREGGFAYFNAARLDIIASRHFLGSKDERNDSLETHAVDSPDFAGNAVRVAGGPVFNSHHPR